MPNSQNKDSKLKILRYVTHLYLDGIWKICTNKKSRNCMYKWLSIQMNLSIDETHISKFNYKQCKQAIEILRPRYIQLYGRDLESKKKEKGDKNIMSDKVQITRHEEFEVSHLLPGHQKGCGRLHGHTYKIEVTIEGPRSIEKEWGMILDFGILKEAIKEVVPDHYFVYDISDEIGTAIANTLKEYDIQSISYPFPTTAENMVGFYAKQIEEYIQNKMDLESIQVVKVNLWETTNSFATYLK